VAVRRGKPDALLDEVAFCARLGWTWTQLQEQPAWFVERMNVYLEAVDDEAERARRRGEEELKQKMGLMR